MGSINKQISRYETTAVYTHPDAKVDIVLVHGLNGDPERTWTAKNDVFWPADLLPTSLRDARANVLVYGYNADVYSKKHGSHPSDNFIFMHAQTLVTSLTHYRKDEQSSQNPIIWVCHSLGGILVKRALLYSNDLKASQHEDYRSIYVSTYGIIFLGTPHTGSGIATWGTMLQAMSDTVVPRTFFQSESVLLRTLKRDNETLQNINSHFLDIYQRFKILMAHENHKTDLKGTRTLIVDANSASPQLPGVTYYAIEATHSGMCKFDNKNAPGYRTIATALREWALDAPDVIATRWRVEEDEKLQRAKHEIEERMKPWLDAQRLQHIGQGSIPQQQHNETTLPSTQDPSKIDHQSRPLITGPATPNQPPEEEYFPSQQSKSDHDPSQEPLFVKPTVFRPNTFFKGRDQELKLLHKMLTDRKRRSVGTSSVLIQSMPGGGKTHLARQYVFRHRYDYSGGIFWIRAKSIEELDYGYWDIAKTVGVSEKSILNQRGSTDTVKMVKAVQLWLSSHDNWLLILDGIHFDLPDLQHYIPFARHTSIIYTSTERTTGEDYQFDNPQVIALDSLTKQEAQELLFEEMGKRQPYTQDDLRRAEELVELMDRLPLMIHVAALQLKATREPLAGYLRSFRNRPKVGNLPAYRAVREQLEHRGASAALNLMSLLSFFGTHIPVEMIILGAKALDKRTPVKSAGPETRRSSLNNTFKTLIAFALVERNENEASSASSRSTRSVDMGQDSLDILRIHGIVQAFFVDVLAEEKQAPFWLERAVCMFCKAFDVSNQRVDEDPQTGVPEDFRRLLIHGERLLTHLGRFEKRHPDLAASRKSVESRLAKVNVRIEQLTRRVTEIVEQGSVSGVVSVFERTNSLSEDDLETPPSHSSTTEPYLLDDEGLLPLESPSMYTPTDHNPYHWHTPYPHDVHHDNVDYSRTVTPHLAPTEIFESMSMPDDDEVTRKVFGPNHRTIKRHAERRYRDRAGSWRAASRILSDPRVSISRETAKGIINQAAIVQSTRPRSSTDSASSEATKAQLTLDRINKGSPSFQPRSVESNTDYADSITSSIRPRLIAGRPSYADAKAEAAVGDISATFSSPAPSPNYAAAAILKRRENEHSVSLDGLTPIKVSSPLSAAPLTTISPSSPSPPATQPSSFLEGDKTGYIPKPPSRPASKTASRSPSNSPSRRPSRPSSTVLSRSARSSPSHPTSPFPPPPIPIEINTSSSLRSPPSPGHPWESYGRLPEQSIGEDDEYQPLSHSYPSIRTHNLPYPHTAHSPPEGLASSEHPPPWVASSMTPNLHPQGYSSQPMSRDPSHQSSHSHGSAGSLGHAASPLALSSSPGSQQMQRPQSRRPSVVETEPSPRLDGLELEPVITSYSLYSESTRGRGRTTSNTTARGSHSSGLLSRFKPSRRGSDGSRRHRSASGRLGGFPWTSKANLSPDLDGHADSEPMARSGSGGIRFGDGKFVEFGSQTLQEQGEPSSSAAPANPGRAAAGGSGSGSGDGSSSPALSTGSPRPGSRLGPRKLSKRNRNGSSRKERPTSAEVGLGIQQQTPEEEQKQPRGSS